MKEHNQSYKVIYQAFLSEERRILRDYHQLRKAYSLLKNQRSSWCSLYSLYYRFKAKESKGSVDHIDNQANKHAESLSYLNAKNWLRPTIQYDGKQKQLTALSNLSWPLFSKKLHDKIYITIGYRKAFCAYNPMPMHHSILLVTDGENHQAVFSFNSPRGDDSRLCLNNDLHNSISQSYTFYDELTISCDNKKQVTELFSNLEKYGHSTKYNIATNNCCSAIAFGLLKAKHLGFNLPRDYYDRLLVILAKEQNFGIGIITNKVLEQNTSRAINHILHSGHVSVNRRCLKA